jgi:hypothetical protein
MVCALVLGQGHIDLQSVNENFTSMYQPSCVFNIKVIPQQNDKFTVCCKPMIFIQAEKTMSVKFVDEVSYAICYSQVSFLAWSSICPLKGQN